MTRMRALGTGAAIALACGAGCASIEGLSGGGTDEPQATADASGPDTDSPYPPSIVADGAARADATTTNSPHDSGAIVDTGANTNSDADANACSRDCRGTACVNGMCEVTPLATAQTTPYGIAVYGNQVYFTDLNAGTIKSVPVTGAAVPTVIAAGQSSPYEIAVDASGIYWINLNGGPNGAVARATFASPPVVTQLAISTPGSPRSMALDTLNVYWLTEDGSTVERTPKNLGTTTPIAQMEQGALHLAGDTSGVFWTTCCGTNSAVRAWAGTTPSTLTSPSAPTAIAVSATDVYFSESVGVRRIGKDGTGLVTISPAVNAWALAVDESAVYWTDVGAKTVNRAMIAGGVVTVLAKGLSGPLHLTVDASFVYWTDGPQVLRVAK